MNLFERLRPQPAEEKKPPREDDLTWLEHWHQLETELRDQVPHSPYKTQAP